MQINQISAPSDFKTDPPYGYTPMDVAVEIRISERGQIGDFVLKPLEIDDKTRKRCWLPDLPRSSNIAPIVGADKLDYYHPTRKPAYYQAMTEALTALLADVPQLQWILDWMRSDKPLELEAKAIDGGRIIWRTLDDGYIHDLPKIRSAHAAQTLVRAGGGGDLLGALPRIHTKKLAVPLFGCNDDMFRSWGQSEKQALNVPAEVATIATLRYAQLLEAKGHHIRISSDRYWVWGALPEMAQLSEANAGMEAFFGSVEAADLDPVEALENLVEEVETGSRRIGKVPEDPKIACGYIGIGGSGKGRAAIGQMSEVQTIEFLDRLLKYHRQQRRYITRSSPYWVFGFLTVAEGSSKKAVEKANEQIFEAMIRGEHPPAAITAAIVQRMKIEGVPNIKGQKLNREWSQLSYLAWCAPEFIEININGKMKPQTTIDNLFAWHVGRVFAACKKMSYFYAHPHQEKTETESNNSQNNEEKKKLSWKDPIDAYRQILFSSPSQGFAQIVAKVSPYLAARTDRRFVYDKTLADLGADCPGMAPPRRWTDEQVFFLALGMSEMAVALRTANSKQKGDESTTLTPES